MNFYIYDKNNLNNKKIFELVTLFKKNNINYIIYDDNSEIDNFIYIGKIVLDNGVLQIEKVSDLEQNDFLLVLKDILANRKPNVLVSDYTGILNAIMLFLGGVQKIEISNVSLGLLKSFNPSLNYTIEQSDDIEILEELPDDDFISNDLEKLQNIAENSTDVNTLEVISRENSVDVSTPEEISNEVPTDVDILGTFSKENLVNDNNLEDNIHNNNIVQSPIGISNQEDIINNYEKSLLTAFIGENYEHLTENKFSKPAFFLSGFYFLYRKLYNYGLSIIIFLVLAINLLMLLVPNTIIGLIISILLYLAIGLWAGLSFNKLYVKLARKQIDKIKVDYAKSSADDVELVCKHQGGVNRGSSLVISFALVLVITIGFYLIGLIGDKKLNPSDDDDKNKPYSGDYKGVLNYSNIDVSDVFSVNIPEDFIADDFTNGRYTFETDGEGIFNECELKFNGIDDYHSAKELIKEMAGYNQVDYKSIVINKNKWYSFSQEGALGKTYSIATDKNGQVYLLEYTIGADANQDVCQTFHDSIVYSVKFKEEE